MKKRYHLAQKITPFIPRLIRDWVRLHIPLVEFDMQRLEDRNPDVKTQGKVFANSNFCFGIIKDVTHSHRHYIAACRELLVSFEVLDILDNDWVRIFRESKCDAFLVWPSSETTISKSVFDYRLRILESDLKKRIYPTWQECWLTEHKPRLRDWLLSKNIPHPKTWVLYRESEALDLSGTLNYPIVGKSATGASGSGVKILKNNKELSHYIKSMFGQGIVVRGSDPRDRHRGYVFLQEYLPNAQEWRMVRIGDSYFGYRKEKGESGLHSASHRWSWIDPGEKLLNLLKHVTDIGGFTSMDVDFFLTEDGRLLVNECQTTFGCTTPVEQMKIDGIEGRYLFEDGIWRFEVGEFSSNHMCNLRISYLLTLLKDSSK
jgi:hypothetical protein